MVYVESAVRSRQIIAAARAVLIRAGVGGMTVRAAAQEAGIPLGTLLDAIDKAGIRDDTVVVFTSDNGAEFFKPWDGWAGPSPHSKAASGCRS